MKRVLITGKGSYIGIHVKAYLEQYPNDYLVKELDVRDDTWKRVDFSVYDVIYHVAGIAHIKENQENEHLYYKVNRDLAYELAKLTKEAGVKQFIFMSSMSVYGLEYSKDMISLETICHPMTAYGKSKLQAEEKIQTLADDDFHVCILRPPMVYGDASPGNMTKLLKLVKKVHVFPTIKNQRSSITIEKLKSAVKTYIDQDAQGIFLPQNDEYMCTVDVVKEKMSMDGVKVLYISIFNPILRLLIGKVQLITKCFGDLKYEK